MSTYRPEAPNAQDLQNRKLFLDTIYGDKAPIARVVIPLLIQHGDRSKLDEISSKLERLIEGKESPEKRDEVIGWLMNGPAVTPEVRLENEVSDRYERLQKTLNEQVQIDLRHEIRADLLAVAKEAKSAEKVLGDRASSLSVAGQLQYADLLYSNGKYAEAAARYALFAEQQSSALAVILRGHASKQAGFADEGDKFIEKGHWLSLAGGTERDFLTRELFRRGFEFEARREIEMSIELGSPNNLNFTFAHYRSSKEHLRTGDFAKAERDIQKCIIGCLRADVTFSDRSLFFSIPQQLKAIEALGKLKNQGDITPLKEHLEVMPGDIATVITAYPLLKKLGRDKESIGVWKNVRDAYANVLKDYPKYAQGWNSIAWLNANCRQELEEGLEAARKAVALQPDNAGYKDTLAECYFCVGEKSKAIELMKVCIEMDPKKSYYQRQLERFQTKSPETSWPLEDED